MTLLRVKASIIEASRMLISRPCSVSGFIPAIGLSCNDTGGINLASFSKTILADKLFSRQNFFSLSSSSARGMIRPITPDPIESVLLINSTLEPRAQPRVRPTYNHLRRNSCRSSSSLFIRMIYAPALSSDKRTRCRVMFRL